MRWNDRYGFRDFAIGDAYKYLGVKANSIQSAAFMFAKRRGWAFKTKTEGKNVIVWRVA